MPRSESKDSDEDENLALELNSNSEQNYGLSPLLGSFAEFCQSDAFDSQLLSFQHANAHSFKNADLEGEQSLEFTRLHEEYIEMIDTMMQTFCERQGITVEELFKEIAEFQDSETMQSFLPAVIGNCEYSHFARQMKAAATEDEAFDFAEQVEQEADEFNLSGIYRADNDSFDINGWNEYLSATKMPWMFRKLFLKAARTIKDVVIEHNPEQEFLFFRFRVNFFGTSDQTYILDGKPRNVTGSKKPWVITGSAYPERKEVSVRMDPHPSLGEGGFIIHKFTEDVDEEDRKVCVWEQQLVDPENDKDIVNTMRFVTDSGSEKGRK
ncbi:hypothetical protein TrVE_jg338 [Triparma verrucosa]|uniref:Cilia- and flagella-associated protein 36 n=1 Tax=Triparma verrucosa TaxID=1606542 RepID=A0A9W7C4T0_9STRA|nr:hypothetical protein TrVE_jg338 [Triparma verrucosa]